MQGIISDTTHGIEARSVNYEDDYEPYLTADGISARDSTSGYNIEKTYTGSSAYYPNIFAQELNAKISGEGNSINLAPNKSPSTEVSGYTQVSSITCKQNYWVNDVNTTNFGPQGAVLNNSTSSWVTSRCVRCDKGYVNFYVRDASTRLSAHYLYLSNHSSRDLQYALRAVVELGPEVVVTPCTGTNGSSNMHTIVYPTNTVDRTGLSIGDYVNYTPSTASYVTLTTSDTGYTSSQTISQETLSWQILDIKDDGTVKLISTPTQTDSNKVYLSGYDGYNHAVRVLNETCEALYSDTTHGIEARSVNYEDDYEPYLTADGISERDSYPGYNTEETFTGGYASYPNIFAQELNAKINGEGNSINLAPNKSPSTEVSGYTIPASSSSSITCKTNDWYALVNTTNFGPQGAVLSNSTSSWLASRCVVLGPNYPYFAVRRGATNLYGLPLFSSTGNQTSALRAVVELGSNVQINKVENNSSSTPHTISW